MGKDNSLGERFERLHSIMVKLRGPGGCPWDAEQTHRSLSRYAIEETYELVEAIESGDSEHIEEELGDLLLQIVFHAVIGEEKQTISMDRVIDRLCEKLIRRHPHVFAETRADTPDEVVANWGQIKKEEKPSRAENIFEGIPAGMPALLEALRISERVAAIGFDWPDLDGLWEKQAEESTELRQAIETGSGVAEELGDLLFVLVNLGRKLGIDPETALTGCNIKFKRRFAELQKMLDPEEASGGIYPIDYLDRLWNLAKGKVG